MSPKNIVLCCDGTANEFAKNNTNVVKLYYTLQQDPTRQVTYYHPGLGTMEPAGALTTFTRKVTKLLGMAVGYGLENDIRDAYVFLMQNYEKDDKVFLFGFSRGAYTVRALASLLKMYGLIRPGNDPLVAYAIRMMVGIQRSDQKNARQQEAIKDYFKLAGGFKETMGRVCVPFFVGVWDTVNSVGWVENPLKLPYIADNADIQFGRHAVSIDEHRAFFRTNLWMPSKTANVHGPKDVLQVWFPGVHSDVGGGYAEDESGLSKFALEWMLQEAKNQGLLVDDAKVQEVLGKSGNKYAPADANAKIHESLKGFWNLAEFIPKKHYNWKKQKQERRMNLYRRRTIPPQSWVHQSAFHRDGGKYAARHVPQDAKPYPPPAAGVGGSSS